MGKSHHTLNFGLTGTWIVAFGSPFGILTNVVDTDRSV